MRLKMIALFLNPIVLIILLWIVARDNAELEFSTLFFVALGIGIGSSAINAVLGERIGFLTIVPNSALAIFFLMRFCCVSLRQSAIVVALFAVYQIAFTFAMEAMISA